MLIRRCAWHRKYRGYPLIFGLGDWRGRRIVFTDGMCRGCAARLRWEWNLTAVSQDDRVRPERVRLPLAVPPGAIALIALAVTLFVARPLDHGPAGVAPPLDAGVTPSVVPSASPRLTVASPAGRADPGPARAAVTHRPPPRAIARAPQPAPAPATPAPIRVARTRPLPAAVRPPRPTIVSEFLRADTAPPPLFPISETRAMLTLYRDPGSPLALLEVQAP